MRDITMIWKDIKTLRSSPNGQSFTSSPFHLVVREYKNENGHNEQEFGL